MFLKNIPLCEPHLSGREGIYLQECVQSGWIATSGPFISRFENKVGEFVGSPHAVGVASGTSALHLALLLCGLEPEEEVLVPTLTFIAPVNCIRYCHAHPVFMDIDPQTWQLDAGKVERFLREECVLQKGVCRNKKTNRRVRAILAVHLLGLCCDIDRLKSLAEEFQLKLIEDAAEALGVRFKGRHVGTFGDVGVLSFNANKLITTGSGGMLLTGDSSLAERARYLSTQAKDDPNEFFHGQIGFNYRLTNLHAAIGLAQMEEIESRIAKKRAIAAFYKEALQSFPAVTVMPTIPHCEATYWLYTILMPTEFQRQQTVAHLQREGIMVRPLFHPIHRLPPYQRSQGYLLEAAEQIYQRGICLPSSLNLEEADLKRVVACLEEKNYAER